MKFYKILYQINHKTPPFYRQVYLNDYIVGKNNYSFAILYSPQSYNDWLLDDEIFQIFIDSTIKQLVVSNYKFLRILMIIEKLDLNLVDCKFKGVNLDELLEYEQFNINKVMDLLEYEDYELMNVTFRTKRQNVITLKSNGVLGIDEGMSEEEMYNIKRLIEFVSFGPVAVL